jgi:hypothetical protein
LFRRQPLDKVVKGTDFDNLDMTPADFLYRNVDLRPNDADAPRRQIVGTRNPLKKQYDVVIMDCAPNISLVSENVFRVGRRPAGSDDSAPQSEHKFEQLQAHLGKRKLSGLERFPYLSTVDLRRRLQREPAAPFPRQ